MKALAKDNAVHPPNPNTLQGYLAHKITRNSPLPPYDPHMNLGIGLR